MSRKTIWSMLSLVVVLAMLLVACRPTPTPTPTPPPAAKPTEAPTAVPPTPVPEKKQLTPCATLFYCDQASEIQRWPPVLEVQPHTYCVGQNLAKPFGQ
jgi:hypothetical protein